MINNKLLTLADRSAITLSTLCVIHCLLSPIILLVLPTLTSLAILDDEHLHIWLLYGVVPISIFAITFGYVHQRSMPILITALIGLVILVLAGALGHDVFGETGEAVASVIGAALVGFGHLQNLKRRKTSFADYQAIS
ncbi:MerC domain-containing protein [Aliiglaciecola sp. 3_MG-2023]|uniref:MerC domain-containing protein n=1 Tax=Aliiglaciecola sp. 3_MG-2023 TaxID=3062644 RepID=UPI0026E32F48|nr:MerC domain-containing protein [Aliiglaciecola sp. 3_MG-2023]MDO6694625.1 MerC domain-containing protein [Aliiglaciecola sp. 3_MG-2023]